MGKAEKMAKPPLRRASSRKSGEVVKRNSERQYRTSPKIFRRSDGRLSKSARKSGTDPIRCSDDHRETKLQALPRNWEDSVTNAVNENSR